MELHRFVGWWTRPPFKGSPLHKCASIMRSFVTLRNRRKRLMGSASVGRPRLYPDNRARQKAYRARCAAWRTRHGPKVYHRTATTEWSTPPTFFATLHAE